MRNRLKGVTLIETMIYIALFSIILLIIINFMFSAQESTMRNNRRAELQKTIEFLTQHVTDTFDRTNSVNTENCVFLDNQGVLNITTDMVNEYKLEDGRILFNNIPITPKGILVGSFRLEPVNDSFDKTIGVRFSIQLSSREDSPVAQEINLLTVIR